MTTQMVIGFANDYPVRRFILGLYQMSNLPDRVLLDVVCQICLPDSGIGFPIKDFVNCMYALVLLCPSYDAGLCQHGYR